MSILTFGSNFSLIVRNCTNFSLFILNFTLSATFPANFSLFQQISHYDGTPAWQNGICRRAPAR